MKLYFTINTDGEVSNIYQDDGCGFENIDKAMVELINKLPGKWIPAENTAGQKVEQELVISNGLVGC